MSVECCVASHAVKQQSFVGFWDIAFGQIRIVEIHPNVFDIKSFAGNFHSKVQQKAFVRLNSNDQLVVGGIDVVLLPPKQSMRRLV